MTNKKWREHEGRLCHDGDCYFWDTDICTCGLLHHLLPNPPEDDWYWKEWARMRIQMDRVPKPLPYVEPTEEEIAERLKTLDEFFKPE